MTVSATAAYVMAGFYVVAVVAHLQHPRSLIDVGEAIGHARSVTLVPGTEVAIAVVLFVAPSSGGWLAGTYLLAITGLLGIVRLKGIPLPDCGCFGPRFSQEVGPRLFLRNGGLIALAIWVGVGAPTGRPTVAFAIALLSAMVFTVAFQLRARASERYADSSEPLRILTR